MSEVRTIYTFNGKALLKCINNIIEVFRKLLIIIINKSSRISF